MKILLSCYDKADFLQGKVNEEGPSVSFHAFFYKHDRQVILSAKKREEDDVMALHLKNERSVRWLKSRLFLVLVKH